MPYLLLLALVCGAEAPQWNEVPFGAKTLLLHPKCEPMECAHMGPFVTLGDGSILAVDATGVLTSSDGGKTWQSRPLFADPKKYNCRSERAVLCTREGTLLVAFMNQPEMVFRWDQKKGGPQPGCRLPVYVVRSTDEGKTWEEPRLVQDGYCGALRTMIQLRSGRIVLGCQDARANRGRHVCMTYVSDDQGKTWQRSNIIDLATTAVTATTAAASNRPWPS